MNRNGVLFLLVLFSFQGAMAQHKDYRDELTSQEMEFFWDYKALREVPDFQWLDSISSVRSLLYKSVPYQGIETQVFAYYSNPDLLTGNTSDRKFPGIVLVHGGGGTAFKAWVEKWAANGYAAIAMDLNGKNGDSGDELTNPGPVMNQFFRYSSIKSGKLNEMWSFHAVSRVVLAHSFLLGRKEVNKEKTALTGISWGGYLSCIAGCIDNRFKACVPVYGCGFINESEVFSKEFQNMTKDEIDKWLKYFDPSSYLAQAEVPFFFINGNKDAFFNILSYKKTYDLLKNNEKNICIKPDMKHSHEDGWEPEEIRYFIESKINNGITLPKIAAIQSNDSASFTIFETLLGLREAYFYYSLDTLSKNEEKYWMKVKADIDPMTKTLKCTITSKNYEYGFFNIIDNRGASVSSPLFVKSTLLNENGFK